VNLGGGTCSLPQRRFAPVYLLLTVRIVGWVLVSNSLVTGHGLGHRLEISVTTLRKAHDITRAVRMGIIKKRHGNRLIIGGVMEGSRNRGSRKKKWLGGPECIEK